MVAFTGCTTTAPTPVVTAVPTYTLIPTTTTVPVLVATEAKSTSSAPTTGISTPYPPPYHFPKYEIGDIASPTPWIDFGDIILGVNSDQNTYLIQMVETSDEGKTWHYVSSQPNATVYWVRYDKISIKRGNVNPGDLTWNLSLPV